MTLITPQANTARPPAIFSESIERTRAMILAEDGTPLGIGIITHRNTLYGKLTGYRVELVTGRILTVLPAQLFDPQNVAHELPASWANHAARHAMRHGIYPQGAA
jgi:hypothetical protein